jgi:hypothetical protein
MATTARNVQQTAGHLPDRIDELAIAFNGQLRIAAEAPSIKDVRDALQRVESTFRNAAAALASLDDMSVDWLLGNPGPVLAGRHQLSFSQPLGGAGVEVLHFGDPGFIAAVKVALGSPGNTGAFGPTRRDALQPIIDRTLAVQEMAAIALRSFNTAFTDVRGGALSAVEWVMGKPKEQLAEGCWDLAEEHFEPDLLTDSIGKTAPFAKLVRLIFHYATGEDAGPNLDREVKAVAQRRNSQRSEGWDHLNRILRQEKTKPAE